MPRASGAWENFLSHDTGAMCPPCKREQRLSDVRLYGNPLAQVEIAAVCTGSGKSMIEDAIKAGAQVYITGDIDYHTAIETAMEGLALIDAGHYGTEYILRRYEKGSLRAAISGADHILCRGKKIRILSSEENYTI